MKPDLCTCGEFECGEECPRPTFAFIDADEKTIVLGVGLGLMRLADDGVFELTAEGDEWLTTYLKEMNKEDEMKDEHGNYPSEQLYSEKAAITPEDTGRSFHFFETLLNAAEESHPSSKKFYDLLIEVGLLHARKQKDYGKIGDPFANVRSTVEFGVPAWVGALIRMNDKVKRLQSLALHGDLHNESAEDSMLDIAVYALIALVLYGEEGEA